MSSKFFSRAQRNETLELNFPQPGQSISWLTHCSSDLVHVFYFLNYFHWMHPWKRWRWRQCLKPGYRPDCWDKCDSCCINSSVILILRRAYILFFCFVLMIFCLFHRFPQGCSLRGHWECRSNSKSVGVPLIWTLEDWTTTPITQALLWIPPPLLLPPHLSLFIPPLPLPSPNLNLTCTSSSPPAALTTMVIYPSLSLVQ